MKDENNRKESQTQKLLTEFTPFTRLHLRVPLQWVPIQLMVLKWYKDVPGISEHQLRQQNRLLCKTLKTPLSWQLQFSLLSWQLGRCIQCSRHLLLQVTNWQRNKTPIITEKGRLQQDRHLQQEITAISPHALLKHVIYIAVV